MSVRGVAKVGFIPKRRNEVRSLTPRMQLVKRLLMETDLSVPRIAKELGISPGTAKVYSHKVYEVELAANGRITLLIRENDQLRAQLEKLLTGTEAATDPLRSLRHFSYDRGMFTITGVSPTQLAKLLAGLKADPDTSVTEPSPFCYQIVGHGVTAAASFSGEALSVSILKKPWAYPMSAVVSRTEAAIREELAK